MWEVLSKSVAQPNFVKRWNNMLSRVVRSWIFLKDVTSVMKKIPAPQWSLLDLQFAALTCASLIHPLLILIASPYW